MIRSIEKVLAEYRCRKGALRSEVCDYLRVFRRKDYLDTHVDEARFVVFDTETTGFDTSRDSVISIGAVAINQGRISIDDSMELLVRRASIGDREAAAVHGLLSRDLSDGCDEAEAALAFLVYCGRSVLVAQHASFDILMMNRILQRHFGIRLMNDVVDTASLAKRLEKGPYYNLAHKSGEYRLDNLLLRYRIRLHDRHTAAGDAFLTAQLFQRLVSKGKECGIMTVRDLLLR